MIGTKIGNLCHRRFGFNSSIQKQTSKPIKKARYVAGVIWPSVLSLPLTISRTCFSIPSAEFNLPASLDVEACTTDTGVTLCYIGVQNRRSGEKRWRNCKLTILQFNSRGTAPEEYPPICSDHVASCTVSLCTLTGVFVGRCDWACSQQARTLCRQRDCVMGRRRQATESLKTATRDGPHTREAILAPSQTSK